MNETLNVIAKRFSCRDFSDKKVSKEDIEKIVDAGLAAPSGMNRHHWQIIVIDDKKIIDNLDKEALNNMKTISETSYERMVQRGGKVSYNAPVMMLLAIKRAQPSGAELIDCGILAQNISLAATSLGIDNLHCGLIAFSFASERKEQLKSELKVFEEHEVCMAVLLGYANTTKEPHQLEYSKVTYL